MKVIVDTDAGVDDAIALSMVLSEETKKGGVEILGITCVGGNVPLAKVVLNVLSCCKHAGRSDVKVYPGAAGSLLYNEATASFWHGEDGLGDVLSESDRKEDIKFDEKHGIVQRRAHGNSAVLFLVDALMTQPDHSVDLLILGPMTNLALALKMEPRIRDKVGRVVAMGGAFKGRGNITKSAEFNIFGDPEAASICLDYNHTGFKAIEFVDWDATLTYSLTRAAWMELVDASENSFCGKIGHDVMEKSDKQYKKCLFPDPLAMMVLLDPSSALEYSDRFVEVCLGEGMCRGMTVVDWGTHDHSLHKPLDGNKFVHRIVDKIDSEKFKYYLRRAIAIKL